MKFLEIEYDGSDHDDDECHQVDRELGGHAAVAERVGGSIR